MPYRQKSCFFLEVVIQTNSVPVWSIAKAFLEINQRSHLGISDYTGFATNQTLSSPLDFKRNWLQVLLMLAKQADVDLCEWKTFNASGQTQNSVVGHMLCLKSLAILALLKITQSTHLSQSLKISCCGLIISLSITKLFWQYYMKSEKSHTLEMFLK